MLFIGICGASGSGKSALADALCERLGDKCFVIRQDAYYYDHPDLSFKELARLNYDEPQIFDHELLLDDVKKLMAGESITRKCYDYARHRRADCSETVNPPEVLIIEGIHTFHDPRLCEMMYLKLYMKVEPEICLLRRIQRDIKERGRDIDGISTQYLSTVKPMYDKYIKNYVNEADVIVAHGGKNARIVDILAGYVQDELNKRG